MTGARNGQTVVYLRVSTTDQNLDRQEDLKADASKVFEEKASASTRERPMLKQMLDWVREGDLVRVWSIDRLARSLSDLENIVDELKAKGVGIEFVKEGMLFDPHADSTEDHFKVLLFQILGSFAQFERSMNRARQAEGIAKAKARGAYKGRAVALTPEQVQHAKDQVALHVPKSVIARELGVSRSTIYRALGGEDDE